MNKLSILFTIFLLSFVLFISYWLNNEVKRELEIKEKKLSNSPDFFLKNFISYRLDSEGNLNFKLQANTMKYYKHLNESLLSSPFYEDFKENQLNLTIQSENGKISDEGEKIDLINNVLLKRVELENKKEMKLHANNITLLPNKNIMLTKDNVKMIQEPSIEIDGIGLKYDKAEGLIKILKNTHVVYDAK